MSLQEAIAADNVDELYRLIEQDEDLLDRGCEGPFPNTPLHDAADQGKAKVAMEIAILKPSFARKLNRGGHSPIHLALQKKHYHIARALVTLDPKMVRVRGRGGITPLHFVAGGKGNSEHENAELLELLAEFLSTCKSSIEDLTSQGETAVHIAVRLGNIEAFKVLFGWLKRVHLTQILNWKDQYGDTILHIAASERQAEIMKLLIGYTAANAKNYQGVTALDIFQSSPSNDQDLAKRLHRLRHQTRHFNRTLSLSQYFSRELTTFEKFANFLGVQDESARNIILVVSTLIAAATYQAALAPPGGYWQDDSSPDPTANSSSLAKPHQAGEIIMSGVRLYVYEIYNSMAFFVSITTIWVTTLTVEANPLFNIPIPILCAAYVFSFQVSQSDRASEFYLGIFVMVYFLAVLALPVYMQIKHIRVQRRIDATGRHVATLGNRKIQCASQIINLLIGYSNVNVKNFDKRTALDIFKGKPNGGLDVAERFQRQGRRTKYFAHTLSLSEFFSGELTAFDKCANFFRVQDKSVRDIILVVSTLIASVTYQAYLTPPGEYWPDSSSSPAANSTVVTANSSSVAPEIPHHAGDLILDGWRLFWYVIFNSMAFFALITPILAIITFTLEAS